jgi:hypothetical protein
MVKDSLPYKDAPYCTFPCRGLQAFPEQVAMLNDFFYNAALKKSTFFNFQSAYAVCYPAKG